VKKLFLPIIATVQLFPTPLSQDSGAKNSTLSFKKTGSPGLFEGIQGQITRGKHRFLAFLRSDALGLLGHKSTILLGFCSFFARF
jgi:hypothetical protein